MHLYRHPEVIVGAVATVLYHMHRTTAAENAQHDAWIRKHDIQNQDRALLHVILQL